MLHLPRSNIARIVIPAEGAPNFARLVGQVADLLTTRVCAGCSATLDRDDMAVFDLRATRIVILLTEAGRSVPDDTVCLTVGVGDPSDEQERPIPWVPHALICSKIVDLIARLCNVSEVSLRTVFDRLTPETVDRIATDMPPVADIPPPAVTVYSRPLPRRAWREEAMEVANDMPDLPRADLQGAGAVHARLSADPAKRPTATIPIRVSATAMDITLVMVCLPLGAAMLTYHVLRGGEMRRTAQMMTAAGILLTVLRDWGVGDMLALV